MNHKALQLKLGEALNATTASKMELDAHISLFEAACIRNDISLMQHHERSAEAALRSHIDAIQSKYTIVRQMYPGA